MAQQSDIEKKTNKIYNSQLQDGKEFEQMQAAQNQLLQIQAAQNQNLVEQRTIGNSLDAQNQILAQAAEIGAMSVNQPTQGVLNKYGLSRPITTSTTKQSSVVTKQNITINNNTTNITNTAADIGGPIQGRGIQFNDNSSANTNKFRDWINKTFQKQGEETRKRDIEYSRRESSLTKSSNKIMRKLEDFSKSITKRLDPRRITESFGDGLKNILTIFGLGFLAKNTSKILDGIEYIQKAASELFSWISGDSKTPQFILDIEQRITDGFGRILMGDKYIPGGKEHHGLLWGLWNKDRTGILNQMFDNISSIFSERSSLAKSVVPAPKITNLMEDPLKSIQEILGYFTSYISVLLGGKDAASKAISTAAKTLGNDLSDGKVEKEANARAYFGSGKRLREGGEITDDEYNTEIAGLADSPAAQAAAIFAKKSTKTVDTSYSAGVLNYTEKGWNPNIGNTGFIPSVSLTKAKNGEEILDRSNIASISTFAGVRYAMEHRDKGESAASALNYLRYLGNAVDNYGTVHATKADLEKIVGKDKIKEVGESINTYRVVRTKTVAERYPDDIAVSRVIGEMFAGAKSRLYSAGLATALGIIGSVCFIIPGGQAVGWAMLSLSLVSTVSSVLPQEIIGGTLAGLNAGDEKRKFDKDDLIGDYVKLDIESLKTFWARYGDFYIPLNKLGRANIKNLNKLDIETISDGNRADEKAVIVRPDYNRFREIIKRAKEVEVADQKMYFIDLESNIGSLFDDEKLKRIVNSGEYFNKTGEIYEVGKEGLQVINESVSGIAGFSPYLVSGNENNLRAFSRNWGNTEGSETLLQNATSISISTQSGERIYDPIIGAVPEETNTAGGEGKGMPIILDQVKQEAASGNFNVNTTSYTNDGIARVTNKTSSGSESGTGNPKESLSKKEYLMKNGLVCSGLADNYILSPNCSKRTGEIKKITIHHMSGVLSGKECGEIFAKPEREASSNYGIGVGGDIWLYVPENYRSWCSSSSKNDQVAITIEVSNSEMGEPWPISSESKSSLIALCADICRRYGINKVNYDGTPNGVLTEHRMFASTDCPGTTIHGWLVNGSLVNEINNAISSGWTNPPAKTVPAGDWKPIGGNRTGSGKSGDDGPFSNFQMMLAQAWENSKVTVKRFANGIVEEAKATENYIEGSFKYNTRAMTESTKQALAKYTSGVPSNTSYVNKIKGIYKNQGKTMSEQTERIVSTLFDDSGNLVINTDTLNPEILKCIEDIRALVKENNEISIADVETACSIADSEFAITMSTSQASLEAISGLTDSKTPRSSFINSDIDS